MGVWIGASWEKIYKQREVVGLGTLWSQVDVVGTVALTGENLRDTHEGSLCAMNLELSVGGAAGFRIL